MWRTVPIFVCRDAAKIIPHLAFWQVLLGAGYCLGDIGFKPFGVGRGNPADFQPHTGNCGLIEGVMDRRRPRRLSSYGDCILRVGQRNFGGYSLAVFEHSAA